MNNWEMGVVLNYLANKTQAGNTFNSVELETELNFRSHQLFKQRLGLSQEYQYGTPVARQGFGITAKALVDLKDFIINKDIVFAEGVTAHPENFIYPIVMKYNKVENSANCKTTSQVKIIELVDQGQKAMRDISRLMPITKEYPVYTFDGTNISVFPESIKRAKYTYLKIPDRAIIKTTIVNDEEVYDAAGSTELEWNELAKLDIIAMVLGDMGLNLNSQDIQAAANQLKIQGV